MTSSPEFIHLHVHSAYSLLAGTMKIPTLIAAAKADKQPAINIADTDNLFGALEFAELAVENGIQPIVGASFAIDFAGEHSIPSQDDKHVNEKKRIVLIAATADGWQNLMKLISNIYVNNSNNGPIAIGLRELEDSNSGLIVLSGGISGPIDDCLTRGQILLARQRLQQLKVIFGNRLYVEIQRYERATDSYDETLLLELADDIDLDIVATNEPYFLHREDYKAHQVLYAINEKQALTEGFKSKTTPEHYLKTRSELVELFKDLPEALDNTIVIAKRCSYCPLARTPFIPKFISNNPDADIAVSISDNTNGESESSILKRQALTGLQRRLSVNGCAPSTTMEDYKYRLDFELSIIEKMEFSGYFLIVADFVQWAKTQQIPVGPGRGSGAGSLVAWALTITGIDPLRFGLLFERFLNPERVSMPDFDIDFCQERRDEVIEYVRQKYGHNHVAHIITFGTLQARAVLRDVGKVLQIPYVQVDRLIKLIPNTPPSSTISLQQIISEEPKLQEARTTDPVIGNLLDISIRLEGLYRHASTHAAGIVIGDSPLNMLVPLYRDPHSDVIVTQYNMKWVEKAGLIKFDFLGLKTLSVLSNALKLLNKRNIVIDLTTLPIDDEKTFNLLSQGKTIGVFQLESQGIRRAIKVIAPDRFEDIIALISLYRPGPIANIAVYGARKRGVEKSHYLHSLLEPLLRETYGIIVYQEQVIEISRILAGYSSGEADLLRRAMGKKNKAEMELQRLRFLQGAAVNGICNDKANEIFNLLAKFAGYGFNKSHATAYALIAYQTAYMKTHFPVEFIAASMTLDISNTDKLNDFRREAADFGVTIEPPSINFSGITFEVNNGKIIYAMTAIRGVGRQTAEHIVSMRGANPFRNLTDFACRVDPVYINKRILEQMIAAGAMDCLDYNRARVTQAIDSIINVSVRSHQDAKSGQRSLLFDHSRKDDSVFFPQVEPWTVLEKLQREYQSIGFYLSAHPLDAYIQGLKKKGVKLWSEFVEATTDKQSAHVRLVGIVISRQQRKTNNGNKIGIARMSDPSGEYDVILFSEAMSRYWDLLNSGQMVIMSVHTQRKESDDRFSLRVDTVKFLESERVVCSMPTIRIFVTVITAIFLIKQELRSDIHGGVSVILELHTKGKAISVELPGKWFVSSQLITDLKSIHGVSGIQEICSLALLVLCVTSYFL